MKHLPWILLVFAASPAYSDSKGVGFYRVTTITFEGKKMDLAAEFKKSMKGDAKFELDFMRMTIDIQAKKLTIGVDQVMGEPGDTSYCHVQASASIKIENGKFTIPSLEGSGHAGVVRVKTKDDSTNTKKKTTRCNVSLDGGTYAIKGSGKTIELAYTDSDGKPVTIQLVADNADVDLQARAATFAARK